MSVRAIRSIGLPISCVHGTRSCSRIQVRRMNRASRGRSSKYHLDSLTSRKEEIVFEHFCRRLAEKGSLPEPLTADRTHRWRRQ